MTDAEQIAAFIAAKGVTRVPEGEGTLNHVSARDWHKAIRSDARLNGSETARLIAERHYVTDHLGRVRVCNGLGEWIA